MVSEKLKKKVKEYKMPKELKRLFGKAILKEEYHKNPKKYLKRLIKN